MNTTDHKTAESRKKGLWMLLSLLLCLGLCFAGCGETPKESGSDKPDGKNSGSVYTSGEDPGGNDDSGSTEAAFISTVTLKGVSMTMGEDVTPVLEALGAYVSCYASESCAFVGQDKQYTYNGFVIMTYPDGDTDRISSVVLTSDAVTTGEGLYIGAAESSIEASLGKDHTGEGGSYLFRGRKAQLLILVEGGKISSIQYSAVFE